MRPTAAIGRHDSSGRSTGLLGCTDAATNVAPPIGGEDEAPVVHPPVERGRDPGHPRDGEQTDDATDSRARSSNATLRRSPAEHDHRQDRTDEQVPMHGCRCRKYERSHPNSWKKSVMSTNETNASPPIRTMTARFRPRARYRRPPSNGGQTQIPLFLDGERPRVAQRVDSTTSPKIVYQLLTYSSDAMPMPRGAVQLPRICDEHRVRAGDQQEDEQRRKELGAPGGSRSVPRRSGRSARDRSEATT